MKTLKIFIFLFGFWPVVHAQSVPGTLSYQGILLQNDGITPIADGMHNIVFSFYNVSSGGAPLFSRTIDVTTTKGLYTCIIGDGIAGNAALDASQIGPQQIFIGVTVDGSSELAPRAQLTSTPYSFQTQSAYTMDAAGLTGTIDPARLPATTLTGTGTAGNVAFWSGGTSLGNDAGLFWDNSLKRLGIGTVSPGYKLQITGNVDLFLKNSTSNSALHLRSDNTGNAFLNNMNNFNSNGTAANNQLVITGQSAIILATGNAGSIGTERMRIDGATGNVGIGVTNPSEKLQIQSGHIALNNAYDLKWGVSANNRAFIRGYDNPTSYLAFGTDGQYRAYIDLNGNFGIGSTSPTSLLHVGNTSLTSTDLKIESFINNGNSTSSITFAAGATNNPASYRMKLLAGWSVGFNTEQFVLEEIGGNEILRIIRGSAVWGLQPGEDDTYDLGQSPRRWREVWAVDGSVNTSDVRLKSNIKDLNYGLKDLLKLRPISFTWSSKPERGRKLGLIAQDVGAVIPEVVRKPESEGFLGITYDQLIPVLIQAIKEQQSQIDEIKATNRSLEQRVQAIEALLNKSTSANSIQESKLDKH